MAFSVLLLKNYQWYRSHKNVIDLSCKIYVRILGNRLFIGFGVVDFNDR